MVAASYQQKIGTPLALRDWVWLTLALGCVLALVQWGWPSPDGRYFIHEAKTWLTTGSLAHDVTWSDWQAFHAQGGDGRYYGLTNEMTMVLTLAPFVALAELVTSLVPSLGGNPALYALASLHNLLATLGCGLLMAGVAQTFGLSRRKVIASALLLVIATPLLHYSARPYREPLIVLSFLLAVLGLLKIGRGGGFGWWGAWLVGVFLVWTLRVTDALILLVLPLATLPQAPFGHGRWLRPRQVAAALVAMVLAAASLSLWQQATAPARASIEVRSLVGGVADTLFLNINGSEALRDWADHPPEGGWWVPLLRLSGLLVAPGKGMLWFGLPLMLGVVVALRRWREDEAARIVALTALLSLGGYAFYSAWFTGAWGPRLLLAPWSLGMVMFVHWGCGHWQSKVRWRRAMMLLILAVSATIGISGALVNDRPDNESAPSHVPRTTRLRQAWQPELTPLWFHLKRSVTPDFGPVDVTGLLQGRPTARKQVTQGWVVWWCVLWRANLYRWPVAVTTAALVLLLGLALVKLGRSAATWTES